MGKKQAQSSYLHQACMRQQMVTTPEALLRDKEAKIKVSLQMLPYLADHGFQELVVLPGSFYIEAAIFLHSTLFGNISSILKNVTFENPVIFSGEDTIIKAKVKDRGNNCVVYEFFEASAENISSENKGQYFAKIEMGTNQTTDPVKLREEFSIEDFQAQSSSTIFSNEFYKKLRSNGNQFGPHFQNLSAVWISGDQALGKLSFSKHKDETIQHFLPPTLVDSLIQLLSAFIIHKGKTFILRAIENIEILDNKFPDKLWAHSTLLSDVEKNDIGYSGDVRLFDDFGNTYLKLFGVSFTYLDRFENEIEEAASKANICIASTFTAEPIENPLNFWSNYFNLTTNIRFAPYNQVFQQLLDPQSIFMKNNEGVNIILLDIGDWAENGKPKIFNVRRNNLEEIFRNKSRHILPNNLEIVHLNRYETDYVYKEIFEDKCYLRHGISINDGDTVIDIGANIGLFSLFVNQYCKNPKIYAFEPSPDVYDLLKANCDAYGQNIKTFNCGVSDRQKTAQFTFYENSSVFSSFYADEKGDREAIRAVVRNMLKSEISEELGALEKYVEELTSERLKSKSCECQLISVSDIIKENDIEKINLLKIDAEKSELDIVNGIEDADWIKIDQIVIEIHDKTQKSVNLIESILRQKGYHCALEQEKLLTNSGFYNIYALRKERIKNSDNRAHHVGERENALQRSTEEFCTAIESFMKKSNIPMVVGICPRTTNAEKDSILSVILNQTEENLLSAVSKIPNVYTIDSNDFINRYPVDEVFDRDSYELGHIPYTSEFYASIGTTVFRMFFNLINKPYKVIALDCDNTLWKGVSGEDGAEGIKLSPPFLELQNFIVEQMKAGMLICLCSKNNEEDVFDVFDKRDDMKLKREHLVSWRTNWNMKSENLKSLAKELNLGLDSFIFIDDNPVECADIKINCPEVLTLQLPQNDERIPAFLKNVWVFDHIQMTAEDKKRTKMYRENVQREKYREQSLSLSEFLDGLKLNIDISVPAEDQMSRVSQLTYRTNQFNLTTIRRSENEIKKLLENENYRCQVAKVKDRFGDYGLVGVLLYEIGNDYYKTDTFLLSCRVLGRGVEHKMLSELGKSAKEDGKKYIRIKYVSTEKNQPAFKFIKSIGAQYKTELDDGYLFTFTNEKLANLKYEPDLRHQPDDKTSIDKADKNRNKQQSGIASLPDLMQKIGDEIFNIDLIVENIEKYRVERNSNYTDDYIEPGSDLEINLSNIWQKVLGKRKIGINDNFFEASGTSLKAVQVIATIKKELKLSLSIVSLFECPTIRLLSKKINDLKSKKGNKDHALKAIERGSKRKKARIVRKKVNAMIREENK